MMHRTLATAGHVDHGKSALVRALTGMEPDRLVEERRRGLTIELGYAWTDLSDVGGGAVAFVDVPGHERLVRMMLAGAGTVVGALFVVAADDGWSAQSSEHRDVLDLLGVPAVAVAVTKCDAVASERVDAVVEEVRGRVAGTTLQAAPIVCTDALSGRGCAELRRVLAAGIAAVPAPTDDGRPRLWVDRTFAPPGVGTVVTGTLTGGRLAVGDTLRVLPDGREIRVRGLQALAEPVAAAVPGMRVAGDLVGIDHTAIRRGDALVGGGPWRASAELDVWLRVLPGQRVARAGAWTVHAGTAAVGCRVLPLTGPIDGDAAGAVRLRLDAALPLVCGDRVVLREAGRQATVGGGIVADPRPARTPRGRVARSEHAQRLQEVATADPPQRPVLLIELDAAGWRPKDELRAAAGLPRGAALPQELAAVGDAVVLRRHLQRWTQTMATELGPGAHERGTVVDVLTSAGAPAPVTEAVVDTLINDGHLVRTGGRLALPEHAADAATAVSDRASALLDDLMARPFTPEPLETLTARHGVDHRLLTALLNRGEIVRCGRVAFARTAVEAAVTRLAALEAEVGAFTAAQAKTAWETSRRFAIPLLEYLDAAGVTTFDGRLRRLTAAGRRRAGGGSEDGQSVTGPS